ncbi:hypothetical protein [Maricaulis sp.]|uniref:hypothetical protein n=1 Tax=Maricaulis sp. TaxID=1486257 RepID=UPI00260CD77D|nr:hypothetical protein [Maricaulis sp.]
MLRGVFTGLALLAGLATGSGARSELPRPTTHDYVSCLQDPEETVCLLELATRNTTRSILQDSELNRHPDIIGRIQERRGTVPEVAPMPGAEALNEPRRLEYAALDAAQALIDSGATPETALEPVRQTAQGRASRSLMFGQVYLNSGAEIRARVYRRLVLRHAVYEEDAAFTRPSQAHALAALHAWEGELQQSSDFNELHNGQLSAANLFPFYARLGDEQSARRVYHLAHGPRLSLERRMMLEFTLGNQQVALDLLNSADLDERERFDAIVGLRERAIRGDDDELKRWALTVSLEDCETLPPLSLDDFDALAPAGDDAALATLAHCYYSQAQAHHRDSRGFALQALAMLDRIGAAAEADALLARWQGYAQGEAAGEACPGERGQPGRNGRPDRPGQCAIRIYQTMLAHRDRQVEAWDVGHYQFDMALRYDLSAGRGLRNLELYQPFARSQGEIDIALNSCVSEYIGMRTLNLDLAEICARRLIDMSGNRALSEHEQYLDSIGALDPPRRQSGPYRAAETAIALAGAAARQGQQDLAEEMLAAALEIWRNQPVSAPPIGARFGIKHVIVARLETED